MITTSPSVTVLLLLLAAGAIAAMIYLSRNMTTLMDDVAVGRAMLAGLWVIFSLGMVLIYLLLTR